MHGFADRRQFLKLAWMFEGGLLLAAVLLSLIPLLGVDLASMMHWDVAALAWGVGATLPMFALFLLSIRFQPRPLARIHAILLELLGPSLAACRWYDLIVVALLAGISEEVLFRGVLQVSLENCQVWLESKVGFASSVPVGLLAASVLFGLAHAMTPTYALLAGAIGVYLGVLMGITGQRNLVAPILAHGLYDYLAFLVVVRRYRSREGGGSPPEALDAISASSSRA